MPAGFVFIRKEEEDIEHTLVFFVGKLIAARLLSYELVDKIRKSFGNMGILF